MYREEEDDRPGDAADDRRTVRISLRVTPETRAAARALTKTLFYEWHEGRVVQGVGLGRMEDAYAFLLVSGMRAALAHLRPDLLDKGRDLRAWLGILRAASWSPDSSVSTTSFPPGTPEREELEAAVQSRRWSLPEPGRPIPYDEPFATEDIAPRLHEAQRRWSGLAAAAELLTDAVDAAGLRHARLKDERVVPLDRRKVGGNPR